MMIAATSIPARDMMQHHSDLPWLYGIILYQSKEDRNIQYSVRIGDRLICRPPL
jgi:hypothetical protein